MMLKKQLMTSGFSYRADIDGLRGVAILFVLIFHFKLLPFTLGGFVGVDVFFVISGFLITAIILRRLEAGDFSFWGFYIKRVRRLAPALFAVIAFVYMAGYYLLLPSELIELSKQSLAAQFYFSNFYYWQNINYFDLQAKELLLLHTWSLAVEEQFYLFYPVFLYLTFRFMRRYLWHIIGVVCFVSFLANMLIVESKESAAFYLLPTRAWELLAGALAFRFGGGKYFEAYANYIGLVGFSLILGAVFFYKPEYHFPGVYALLPVLGAVFLIISGRVKDCFTTRILNAKVLVYVGMISYSLYLVHWPINVLAEQYLFVDYNFQLRLLMFIFSLCLSIFLYYFVEMPFRGWSVSAKNLMRGYAVGLVFSALIFSSVIYLDGVSFRLNIELKKIAGYMTDRAPNSDQCQYVHLGHADVSEDDFCKIGVKNKAPTMIIYGDSHVWAAQSAFDKWLVKNNKSALFIFNYSCLPILDLYHFKRNGQCVEYNDKVASYALNQKNIDSVFFVSIWVQPINGMIENVDGEKLQAEEAIDLFEEKFTSTISKYNMAGKNIYIWEPVPGSKYNVPKKMFVSRIMGRKFEESEIEYTRNEYQSRFQYLFSSISKNKKLIKGVFSPSDSLCGSGTCSVIQKEIPVYFDDNHILFSSSEFWANELHGQLSFSRL